MKNAFPLAGMKDSLKIAQTMEKCGFHSAEDQFSLARIKHVIKDTLMQTNF